MATFDAAPVETRKSLASALSEALSRPVFGPWLVSRAVVAFCLMVLGARSAHDIPDYTRLVTWDGNWYRIIATTGYGPPPHAGVWSTWPFFPLLPALTWLAHQARSPYTVAMLAFSNAAAFVALAGVRRATLLVSDERAGRFAVWLTALFPGAITLVMAYPDSLYLAGAVWALLFAAQRRPMFAGLAALVATAARPNGFLLLIALAVAVVAARPDEGRASTTALWRALVVALGPSVVFLAGWCAWLWRATGDPIVFLRAKGAWVEATLAGVVTSPWPHRWAIVHLVVTALLAIPFVARWRAYPMTWRVLVVLSLAPSLVFGIVGLARYGISCFPLAVAAGDAVSRRSHSTARGSLPRWPLVASGVGLIWFALMITQWSYVP